MFAMKRRCRQTGVSMIEAVIAVPLIFVACLLTLQMMLLYRAKISLNFAAQEAARIGAMSNGRVVPRFLTDITQFSTVFRTKNKCIRGSSTVVAPLPTGTCPAGSTAEGVSPNLPSSSVPGSSTSSDGNEPTGPQFSSAPASGAASSPAPVPSASAAASARSGGSAAATKFLKDLGRGMLRYGDSSVLQGFIIGITPLYTEGLQTIDAAKGQLNAFGDAMMNSCIIYHNPTHAAFLDFGFMEIDGPDSLVLQIPNDVLRYRVPGNVDPAGRHIGYYKSKGKFLSDEEPGLRGAVSSMSVQDATLLSIEIKYSYPLKVPIAREILIGLARLTGGLTDGQTAMSSAFTTSSLAKGRWPMASFATYRMQTPVHWHMFYPFGSIGNYKTPELEAFDAIQILYNKVAEKVNNKFDPADPQIGFCPGLIFEMASGKTANNNDTKLWFGKDYDTIKP